MLSATFYVTAIILRYTKNIYKICNCKPLPESKFPNEYTLQWCNFHSNPSTFEKVIAKIQRGFDFMKHSVDTLLYFTHHQS